ncbi:MAG: homospermidine synthase [Magnetococcales bacterium]|nr:homospermidine synthase [Magnetococcales bacterium]
MKHAHHAGRLVIVGFGSIGQGVLPLILKHIDMDPARISIVTAESRGKEVADCYNVSFHQLELTQDNYRDVLASFVGPGDFLVNVSVEVSSLALMVFCREVGALYLDTCIEPWAGGYTDPSLTPSWRTNYALRESVLQLKSTHSQPTAVVTHGANPGLVSHFVKQALLDIAHDTGRALVLSQDHRLGWATLAQELGVKTIHIAERDTQVSNRCTKAVGEFVNTWSIDGFVSEGCQPAELGWGSHERHWPHDAHRHDFGCQSAIYLLRPGASQRVRSWTPLEGPFHGFLITHNESISIADYLTVGKGAEATYRPTVHYAYHPADDAVLSLHELAGKNWVLQSRKRLMMDEISSGIDELGVLLMGHAKGAYWYGSRLSIGEARELVRFNNATSLQVTVAVLAGIVWALENPMKGVVEPDEMDFQRILGICRPYLGEVVGKYSNWTPLQDRQRLFPEQVDLEDPWQFKNFRVE